MKIYSDRAGKLITHLTQYKYFMPTSLFDVEISIDNEMSSLLSKANLLLGKLDGYGKMLPDRDLFISMYVQKEAVVSNQIEGTQVSLVDVLQSQCSNGVNRKHIQDVVNYVNSLNEGIKLLDQLPICTRYFKQIHKLLLKGIRGNEKLPGELRNSQNWIGPQNCTLATASFVPPCPEQMQKCLNGLEMFINRQQGSIQPLIDIALIHYQFETIHPFLDGNGRLGRILIPLWLINNKTINSPLIYLSLYFKENRNEYYSLLMNVRTKGEYEDWIKFFLRAIIYTANDAIETIDKIINLQKEIVCDLALSKIANTKYLVKVIDFMYKQPYFTSSELVKALDISKPTALDTINKLLKLNIISKKDNKKRNSTYCFTRYVNILKPGTEL